MKTGNNKATNNFIIRFWSSTHYGEKIYVRSNLFVGTITDVKSKEQVHFHNAVQFNNKLDAMNRKAEKRR